MVLLEAMAVGLPLISFDCKCGPRDIIDDGKNGFLIPDGDSRLMEQRICCLMNDEIIRKKQGLEAKEVASKYSHEVIMNEWIHLFNKNKQAKK
jgi:glycosyltransferase involved in cell wall biosynthesis